MAVIYVVEDDKNIKEIEAIALKNSGYSVEMFEYAEDFLNALKVQLPDLLLLDIMLPDADGLELVEKLRKDNVTKQLPIILVTAKTTELDKVKGLDIGADDYMVKPFEFRELLARIRVMTRKKVNVKENVYKCDDLTIDCNKRVVKRGENIIDLSPREHAILLFMIRNKGIVLTREQIVSNIWDLERSGSSNVVDVYIRYLRKKIDDGHEHKFIQTIRGAGYLLKGRE